MTRNQLKVLEFVDRYIKETGGVSPSYREIAKGVGMSSVSGVDRCINALSHMGFIRKHTAKHRSIEVLRMPRIEKSPALQSHG